MQIPLGCESPGVLQYRPASHIVHASSDPRPVVLPYRPRGQGGGDSPVPVWSGVRWDGVGWGEAEWVGIGLNGGGVG